MASVIEGYTYDIFISYRQKDNKYDGWVTEFVDNLKHELESMFKEEVTVYFDINPSDYLLESYDVDASLKEKLKCLVFIPIISRTYCDPKAFAWDNELKAFVNQATGDQFGFKIKLPNGNVANRVLPVRIHDLNPADIKLFELVVGGVMRSIDFVYKETGVNRQLRAKDDDIIKSPNQILYRDQINKVALAIMDIIDSMKSPAGPELPKEKEIKVREDEEKKDIGVEEAIIERKIQSVQEVRADKIIPKKEKKLMSVRNEKILIPGVLVILAILAGVIFLLNRHSKVKWAKEKALTEIEQAINILDYSTSFYLVQKAKKYISQEPKFKKLATSVIARLTVLTDPPGAEVYIREYSDFGREFIKIGTTPIDSMKMPISTFYLVKFEKKGYEKVIAVARTGSDTLFRKLFPQGTIPTDMVYVEGYANEVAANFLKEKNGFFMDRHEVNNKQYKEFVDNGGYRNQVYWKNEFKKNDKILTWEEAMAEFTDKSGRPGPSTWEAGDYPEGQDNYPVSGVSWYEAAAYAEFVGKSLPTGNHWRSGAGFYSNMTSFFSSKIVPVSNFNNKGPEPVEKFSSINSFGAYDMAGNVREWCWNETEIGRIIHGGAWDDATYMYSALSQLPSFDRSPKNGFRCVKYISKEKNPESAFQRIEVGIVRDFLKETPIPENSFRIYKNQFLYDKKELNAKIEKRDDRAEDWIIEKITFDAAYGNEKMIAYLYLPKNSSPPYQTLIYFPGASALLEKDLVASRGPLWFNDFILKNGRATIFPVYKGTFERNDGQTTNVPNHSHKYTDDLIKWVKDCSRTIDYLETRSDIDSSKLGFYGISWGGRLGAIIPAVEKRLKLSVLVIGGFNYRTTNFPYPEAEELNYVSKIGIPVLMLNGKYDYNFPLETTVKPFFNLLGTPEKDKHLCIYETDHYVPKNEMIKEVLNWLDKYFGPVK